MKKKNKNLILIFFLASLSYSCQSVTDGLTLKKKDSSNQFLIEKKQPLVMPPDFDELPKPGSINSKDQQELKLDEKIDLEKLTKKKENSNTSTKNNNLSNEIKKKINKKLEN
tara:strand:+ start:53 stop:388 length:336 start_codon:yes stop_codon:yes gene_type:complete